MRMILVRHGQSEANAKRVLQGHMDSPLSNQGRLQARNLAQRMITLGCTTFDLMYSSDLSRAAETAQIISQTLKIDKITEEYKGDFNEIRNNLNTMIENLNHFAIDVQK